MWHRHSCLCGWQACATFRNLRGFKSTDKSVCATPLRADCRQRPLRLAENPVRPDPLLVQLVEHHRLQNFEAVPHRAPETDLRGFVEVARRDWHLADTHPLRNALRDDLR